MDSLLHRRCGALEHPPGIDAMSARVSRELDEVEELVRHRAVEAAEAPLRARIERVGDDHERAAPRRRSGERDAE